MLSLQNKIVRNDIYSIGKLAPTHPVYLLVGHQDEELVVKYNVTARTAQLDHNLLVMSLVDSNAKQVQLDWSEVLQLRNWAFSMKMQINDPPTQRVLDEVIHGTRDNSGRWIKMEKKKLVILDSAMAEMGKQPADKTQIRQIGSALASAGGLEKLGEIVAADLFNGNPDRFNCQLNGQTGNLEDNTGMPCGNNKVFHHLNNLGNIMVVLDGSPNAKPIGLDSYDQSSRFKKWGPRLADLEQDQHHGKWPGRILGVTRKADLQTFAVRAVKDLETAMKPRHRRIPFATKSRLGKHAVERFLTGLEQGAVKLVRELRARYQREKMPDGLRDRLHLLCR